MCGSAHICMGRYQLVTRRDLGTTVGVSVSRWGNGRKTFLTQRLENNCENWFSLSKICILKIKLGLTACLYLPGHLTSSNFLHFEAKSYNFALPLFLDLSSNSKGLGLRNKVLILLRLLRNFWFKIFPKRWTIKSKTRRKILSLGSCWDIGKHESSWEWTLPIISSGFYLWPWKTLTSQEKTSDR